MPEIKELNVKAREVNVKDLLLAVYGANGDEVVSGIKVVQALTSSATIVEAVSKGTSNATLETNRGRVIVKGNADLLVGREVPTQEEVEAKEAEKLLERRDFGQQQAWMWCIGTYNTMQSARAKVQDYLDKGYRASDVATKVQDLVEAEAAWEIADLILSYTGYKGHDIVWAAAKAVQKSKGELLSRGIDDGWSGHSLSKACARLNWEVKRGLVGQSYSFQLSFASYIAKDELNEEEDS